MGTPLVGTLWVRSAPASAATVRHSLEHDLLRAGVDRDLSDDAALLASELVANAIRHAQSLPSGQLAVRWDVDTTGITLRVTDGGGTGRPAPRRAGSDDTTGRGLAIVEAIADEWGVDEQPQYTTVWARLRRGPHPLSHAG